ncbi:MAG: GNAT family N-acetyltransferase [Balneolaceae bacterium]|nr:GNAT family N-acetyltransferase [Balneolaceae bacterium]
MSEFNWIDTSIEGFKLRFANTADVPLIHRFIKELADFENLEDEVVSTEDQLRQNLFGDRSYAEVILGFEGEKPAGFALFFHNFSTFVGKPGIYLEDLFVKQGMRGNGYGREFLTYLARLANHRDCGRLEWAVQEWNEQAIGFYESLGARQKEEWTVYQLAGNRLKELGNSFNHTSQ